MRTLAQVNLEIQKIEKKRRRAKERILHYWKKLDAPYEEQRLLMEGGHPSVCGPEEMPSGN